MAQDGLEKYLQAVAGGKDSGTVERPRGMRFPKSKKK
jgi:hypothetical protein